MRKFFLIDGTGLVYRAFYAIRNLNTSAGEPVNALYGLSRMLTKLLKEKIEKDDRIVFFLDKARKTFRTDMYKAYKANRSEMPEELRFQMAFVEDLVKSFGIKVLSLENVEADDLIATFIKRFDNDSDLFEVVTSDKDLFQLIDDNVKILRAEKGVTQLKEYDRDVFYEKYGFEPTQMIDYLSLMGDSSDNIPGIKGIGDKRAKELISRFGSLEQIYNNLDNVTKANKKRLEESKEEGFLSKKLVQLKDDVAIEGEYANPDKYSYAGINLKEMTKLFSKFQFDSLLSEWSEKSNTQGLLFDDQTDKDKEPNELPQYKTINKEVFKEWLKKLSEQKAFAFDTETTSLNVREAKLVGVSFSWGPENTYYLPFGHGDLSGNTKNLKMELLKEVLNATKRALVIGHNLKFDFAILKNNGFELPPLYFDTMIASYLLDPDKGKHGLDLLVMEEFSHKMISYGEILSRTSKPLDFSQVSVENATIYSGEDADFTFRLYQRFEKRLQEAGLKTLFQELEMPLLKVLIRMEDNGVYFDRDYLKELSNKTEKLIKDIKHQIYEIAGVEFNLNSPIQLGQILFDKLGLPSQGKTSKSKKYKTGREILEKLAGDYKIAKMMLDYRKYSKLKSTYIDAIPTYISKKTGRVHSSFNQIGTATGRLSSSDPNLQNLPIKEEEGREIRNAIKPQKKNWKLISADYSQIELRLMAHICSDENLITAFNKNLDVHSFTASKIFSVDMDHVTKEQRSIGKMINFSIIYGISAYGLSSRIGITVKEAEKFINEYFKAYPKVKEYMDEVEKNAKRDKVVRTIFNRLRKIKYIDASNQRLQHEAKRMAINSPVQGTAADIMKVAMINVQDKINEKKSRCMMIMQIHDEIVLECPDEEVEVMKKMLVQEMENAYSLQVPLKVDVEVTTEF
ncbi:MAG: DNA polymerase I [Thermotogota bacterium]